MLISIKEINEIKDMLFCLLAEKQQNSDKRILKRAHM
jgi:hypothetical protein